MKKIISILTGLLCAATVCLTVTGCNAFKGPTDQWCTMTLSYGNKTVPVAMYYATSETTLTGSSYTEKLPAGLTVFVNANSLIGKNNYMVKTFEEAKSLKEILEDDGSDGEGTTLKFSDAFKMNTSAWTIACLGNAELYQTASTELPGFLKSDSQYTAIASADEFLKTFSWKKLLASKLLDYLGE